MKRICIIGSTTSVVLATCPFAAAADLPASMRIKAPVHVAIYDWTGFYVGGQVGYGQGDLGPGTNAVPEQAVFFPHSLTGLIAGFQAGYNLQLPNRVVLGVEVDALFTSPRDLPKLDPAPFNSTLEYAATARGRIGYAFGTILPYVTGGLAWGQSRVNINVNDGVTPLSSQFLPHVGWTAGLGIEKAVGGNWTAKIEYDYIDLARRTYGLGDAMLPDLDVDPKIHVIKVGLNYKLGDTPPWAPAPIVDAFVATVDTALERAKAARAGHEENGVVLATFFKAKGLQWHTVIITSCNQGIIPHKRAQIEEERKLFYVALTRASSNLIVSYLKTSCKTKVSPSCFLREAGLHG